MHKTVCPVSVFVMKKAIWTEMRVRLAHALCALVDLFRETDSPFYLEDVMRVMIMIIPSRDGLRNYLFIY